MHVGERGELEHQGLGRARHAGERGREHEGEQLELGHVVAERHRARLVLADRLEDLAEGRVDGAVDDEEADAEHREHQVVHRDVVRQVDDAEQVAARHALQAVLAPGRLPLQHDEIHHLRQRQRDHREVDPGAADRQHAEQPAERAGGERAADDAQLRRHAHVTHQHPAHVARAAEEGSVTEGEQAGETEQQVERAREQPEAQDLHQEGGIHRERRHQPDQEQRAEEDRGGTCEHRIRVVHQSDSSPRAQALPNRPAGRTSSTTTMITNTTTAEPSG